MTRSQYNSIISPSLFQYPFEIERDETVSSSGIEPRKVKRKMCVGDMLEQEGKLINYLDWNSTQ